MKAAITSIIAAILIASSVSFAYAEVPGWVKNNAGWWADGTISESEFLTGIEFLIKDGIITVPPTAIPIQSSEGVPDWVKNNAGWWADGITSDGEFVNAITHLIKTGLITVSSSVESEKTMETTSNAVDSELASLKAELEKCSEIVKAYKRLDCEKPIKKAIELYEYKRDAQAFVVGPITYYWVGMGSQGNDFEISPSGQAILTIRMLAENNDSQIRSLNCTSPSICAYDVWDGSKSFKYSGMDFTSGQIVLNPGDARVFNILFGPNIGYGGTEFKYDPSKSYEFRINEDFGKLSIQLDLE
ncbi:MAG: peptidase [Nitrosopumilus sp.]|uniref:peptidase n=1 Tax=Nitrosopumilus sp. TaxID=2024843 RepID=UPI00247E1ECC|nr:peptidase [Nitrosopumilus sp.]MCV0392406.1 peptidase [Nitrosopumilus sp.]